MPAEIFNPLAKSEAARCADIKRYMSRRIHELRITEKFYQEVLLDSQEKIDYFTNVFGCCKDHVTNFEEVHVYGDTPIDYSKLLPPVHCTQRFIDSNGKAHVIPWSKESDKIKAASATESVFHLVREGFSPYGLQTSNGKDMEYYPHQIVVNDTVYPGQRDSTEVPSKEDNEKDFSSLENRGFPHSQLCGLIHVSKPELDIVGPMTPKKEEESLNQHQFEQKTRDTTHGTKSFDNAGGFVVQPSTRKAFRETNSDYESFDGREEGSKPLSKITVPAPMSRCSSSISNRENVSVLNSNSSSSSTLRKNVGSQITGRRMSISSLGGRLDYRPLPPSNSSYKSIRSASSMATTKRNDAPMCSSAGRTRAAPFTPRVVENNEVSSKSSLGQVVPQNPQLPTSGEHRGLSRPASRIASSTLTDVYAFDRGFRSNSTRPPIKVESTIPPPMSKSSLRKCASSFGSYRSSSSMTSTNRRDNILSLWNEPTSSSVQRGIPLQENQLSGSPSSMATTSTRKVGFSENMQNILGPNTSDMSLIRKSSSGTSRRLKLPPRANMFGVEGEDSKTPKNGNEKGFGQKLEARNKTFETQEDVERKSEREQNQLVQEAQDSMQRQLDLRAVLRQEAEEIVQTHVPKVIALLRKSSSFVERYPLTVIIQTFDQFMESRREGIENEEDDLLFFQLENVQTAIKKWYTFRKMCMFAQMSIGESDYYTNEISLFEAFYRAIKGRRIDSKLANDYHSFEMRADECLRKFNDHNCIEKVRLFLTNRLVYYQRNMRMVCDVTMDSIIESILDQFMYPELLKLCVVCHFTTSESPELEERDREAVFLKKLLKHLREHGGYGNLHFA